MVTDKDGRVVYQSKAPLLATVTPVIKENGENPTLILNAPGMETLTIAPPPLEDAPPVTTVQ